MSIKDVIAKQKMAAAKGGRPMLKTKQVPQGRPMMPPQGAKQPIPQRRPIDPRMMRRGM